MSSVGRPDATREAVIHAFRHDPGGLTVSPRFRTAGGPQ